MREGMSYSITWKYRQVAVMAQKKDRSRFTIKFRENDPAHDMTIRILEKQGQRNIAPFLVNAVLHYVQCSETPDMSHMLADNPASIVDRNAIEEIVWGVLRQQGIIQEELKKNIGEERNQESKKDMSKEELNYEDNVMLQNQIDDNMRKVIVRTLSSFRNE